MKKRILALLLAFSCLLSGMVAGVQAVDAKRVTIKLDLTDYNLIAKVSKNGGAPQETVPGEINDYVFDNPNGDYWRRAFFYTQSANKGC